MPRIARIVVPGVAHHVTQRGSSRQDVFFGDGKEWLAAESAEETGALPLGRPRKRQAAAGTK